MPAIKLDEHQLQAEMLPCKGIRSLDNIIDIRGEHAVIDLEKAVETMMNPKEGPRQLPTLLLYDEKGLQLFEDITYLDEYYLTKYEINVLQRYATAMADRVPSGSIVVELGSGNLRKVCLLLQAFEDAGKKIDYYALDLSQNELQRTLAKVPRFQHVSCKGLLGTYDDGREWLRQRADGRPRCIMHLGSSIGNFLRDEAAHFLAGFAEIMQPQDLIYIGVDSCIQADKVYHAYNDAEGLTHQFILNGLVHANRLFAKEIFHVADWKVIGEYVFDEDGGRHQAFVSPIRDTIVLGQHIKPSERIQIEQSMKYSGVGSDKLWQRAGLVEVERWTKGDEYGIHMLQKAKVPFPLAPMLYAPSPLPTVHDWESLWEAWDIVTRRMLPDQELTEKPIKLRNACIFYLGHIPTFLDIQLTKTTGQTPTDPESYYAIFERGIDPDVDNPQQCHQHSETPAEWPKVEEISKYQTKVRARLRNLYEGEIPRHVARAVWLGFEHEIMHIETLLYMMLQSDKTLPPTQTRPDFETMAREAREARVENEWFDVPAQSLTIGLDDPEDGVDPMCDFGWDNEKPTRELNVHAFQAKGRPITNEEYARYMLAANLDQAPTSWTHDEAIDINGTSITKQSNGDLPTSFLDGRCIRTVYGLIPLKQALDWPVFASYDELSGCAAWMGGRIPTIEEARSIYVYVERQKKDLLKSKLANKVPAVNGHLSNNGVEETPPQATSPKVAEQQQLFIDLTSTNTGFQNWHPTPVTSHGTRLSGQSDFGGVWEWTSSPLVRHEGFQPMELYPGYTADFFDGKHNVVLGGSWATHPRIAGRKSFVNWYQRKYPYAWVGARVVRVL